MQAKIMKVIQKYKKLKTKITQNTKKVICY